MNEAIPKARGLLRLEQLVPLCEAIRKGAEYGGALAQASSVVQSVADVPDRLENLGPLVLVLRKSGHLAPRDLLVDIEKIENAGRALEKCVNVEELRDARFSAGDIQEALKRVEDQISKAWSARVESVFRPLQRLGEVLSQIPDTKAAGGELQAWAINALGLGRTAVPTADSVRSLTEAHEELANRLDSLGSLGVDSEVRQFLLEVANRRASLASVTSGVLEWLRAKNAQARFQVELK